MAKNLEEHVRAQETVEVKIPETVTSVKEITGGFEVFTKNGNQYQSKTLIVTAGGRRRKLNVPGEDQYNGRGVAYCSTCDAPLFMNKKVIVVGGGNAGLEAAIDLTSYASEILVFVRSDKLVADPITQAEVLKSPKINVLYKTSIKEIIGDKLVTAVKYDEDGQEKMMAINGVFVEIGSVPNSEMMNGLVAINKIGEIVTDHRLATTSKLGIFAAGDITDDPYKQNNISVGDAVIAALSVYNYLLKIEK